MNAVLAVFLLYFCAVCHGTQGWRHQNERPIVNQPHAQYSRSSPVQQQYVRVVVNQPNAHYSPAPVVQQQNVRTANNPPCAQCPIPAPAVQRQNGPIGALGNAQYSPAPVVQQQNVQTVTNPPRAQYTPAPAQHEYTKYNQPLGWNDDQQLLQQRQSGNHEAQCPCVIRPGTNTCISYDMRYQASMLTEAVYGFPDLTLGVEWQGGAPPDTSIASSQNWDCSSKECQLCASRMTQKLEDVGLMNRPVPGLNFTNTSSSSDDDGWCAHYRFDHPKQPSVPTAPPTPPSSDEQEIIDGIRWLSQMGQQYYQKNQMNAASSSTESSGTSNEKTGTSGGRGKRQSTSSTTTGLLGTRFNISCTAKGDVDMTGGGRTLSLCSSCWAWRQLPDNYFPQYINELICNTQDTVCLSGWASCNQAYRTLSVLRQQPNGTWQPVTIEAGSCCECKVQAGSALNSLVVGLGMSSSLGASPSP